MEEQAERLNSLIEIVLPLKFLENVTHFYKNSHEKLLWDSQCSENVLAKENACNKHNNAVVCTQGLTQDKATQVKICVKQLNVDRAPLFCILSNISQNTAIPDEYLYDVVKKENIKSDSDIKENTTSNNQEHQIQKYLYDVQNENESATFQEQAVTIPQKVKRKRGRPKKIVSSNLDKENAAESLVDTHEKIKNTSKQLTITSNDNCLEGRRYSLRGVKLSEKIMKAEKGLSNLDHEIYNDVDMNNEVEGADTVGDEENNYNPENQEDDCSEGEEKDQDFKPNNTTRHNRKRKYKTIRKTLENNVTTNKKKKRGVIDIGDDIPKYVRRKRNNVRECGCGICKKLFCDFSGVDKHMRMFHSDHPELEQLLEKIKSLKITQCSVCQKEFPDRFRAQAHELSEHFHGENLKCKQCQKEYKNIQSLRNHISAVHNVQGQPHLCHLCPAKFKWAITLSQHIAEIHEGKLPFSCQICKKKFARKPQLKLHERIHGLDPSKRIHCEMCGKGFWYDCNYQRHMRVVHGPHQDKFHCSYCGKGFNEKNSMVSHVQHVHLNIFPYKCLQCKSGFRRKVGLEEHFRQVHKMSNMQVVYSKNRRYKYGRDNEELFFCSHCSLSFCYKTKMIEHMHIDHGKEFPYVCKVCSQGFLAKNYLQNHLQQAHDKSSDESAKIAAQEEGAQGDHLNKIAGIITLDVNKARSGNIQILEKEDESIEAPSEVVEEMQQVCTQVKIETLITDKVNEILFFYLPI